MFRLVHLALPTADASLVAYDRDWLQGKSLFGSHMQGHVGLRYVLYLGYLFDHRPD